MPTFMTKLPSSLGAFLSAQDKLYGEIERDLLVALNSGNSFASVEKAMQSRHGVDSTTVRNVWHNLKGKMAAVRELRKTHLKDLKSKVRSAGDAVKALTKKIDAAKKKGEPTKELRFKLHNKKRYLHRKQSQLERLAAELKSNRVSIAFGSKRLFKAQFHLKENGYSSHEEWLVDWRESRSGNFMMVGNKSYHSGNQLCRLSNDGSLRITVPPALIEQFGHCVEVSGIQFDYGQDWIDSALSLVQRVSRGKKKSSRIGTLEPVTHRFVRKESQWYLHTTVARIDIPRVSSRRNGAIGVDLNANNIAWAYCDRDGNLKHHGQIPLSLDGKSSHQTSDTLSKAVQQIITVASTFQCPVVIEKLDFASKKATLRERGKHYASMLSSFAYSKFGQLIEAKCYRARLQLIEVNPAYSSLVGMTKFMSMYGLNSGTAAGLVLARRCFRLSERLPKPVRAFLSPVDDWKHPWSSWSRLSRQMKGVKRHSFYAMKVRVGVKPVADSSSQEKTPGKPKGTPVILSGTSTLCPRISAHMFNQLCLDF